jgi:hypothetical protein
LGLKARLQSLAGGKRADGGTFSWKGVIATRLRRQPSSVVGLIGYKRTRLWFFLYFFCPMLLPIIYRNRSDGPSVNWCG